MAQRKPLTFHFISERWYFSWGVQVQKTCQNTVLRFSTGKIRDWPWIFKALKINKQPLRPERRPSGTAPPQFLHFTLMHEIVWWNSLATKKTDPFQYWLGSPGGSDSKECACNAGDWYWLWCTRHCVIHGLVHLIPQQLYEEGIISISILQMQNYDKCYKVCSKLHSKQAAQTGFEAKSPYSRDWTHAYVESSISQKGKIFTGELYIYFPEAIMMVEQLVEHCMFSFLGSSCMRKDRKSVV